MRPTKNHGSYMNRAACPSWKFLKLYSKAFDYTSSILEQTQKRRQSTSDCSKIHYLLVGLLFLTHLFPSFENSRYGDWFNIRLTACRESTPKNCLISSFVTHSFTNSKYSWVDRWAAFLSVKPQRLHAQVLPTRSISKALHR